jgi:DNA-binding transcriptional regulator GbsR (MarR family)
MNLEKYFADLLAKEMAEKIDGDIIDSILWESTLKEHPNWHLVQLKWEKGKDTEYFWNEACAWAIEHFGLPGDNYITHPTESYMDFLFKHEQDAILMTLKWI